MNGRIELTGLRVRGQHGVFEHERRDGQDFIVDAILTLDTSTAAKTDELTDTVDYGALAEGLAEVIEGEPCNLIETVAHRLLAVCLCDKRVSAAEVTLHKPSAPIPRTFADVSVTVRADRSRPEGRIVPV